MEDASSTSAESSDASKLDQVISDVPKPPDELNLSKPSEELDIFGLSGEMDATKISKELITTVIAEEKDASKLSIESGVLETSNELDGSKVFEKSDAIKPLEESDAIKISEESDVIKISEKSIVINVLKESAMFQLSAESNTFEISNNLDDTKYSQDSDVSKISEELEAYKPIYESDELKLSNEIESSKLSEDSDVIKLNESGISKLSKESDVSESFEEVNASKPQEKWNSKFERSDELKTLEELVGFITSEELEAPKILNESDSLKPDEELDIRTSKPIEKLDELRHSVASVYEDDKDAESSDDVLGLLAEAVSRDRNESDEEMDIDDEEAHTPESAPEQDESNMEENIDMNLLGENEDDQQNDKEDEIDINEDFTLQFELNSEEESTVTEDFSDNNLITDVVSLATLEKNDSLMETEMNCIDKNLKPEEIQCIENNVSLEKVSLIETKSDDKSNSEDVSSNSSHNNSVEITKLSEDILKGLREEAQKLATGEVSKQDLENFGMEIQNVMKTLFKKALNNKLEDKSSKENEVLDTDENKNKGVFFASSSASLPNSETLSKNVGEYETVLKKIKDGSDVIDLSDEDDLKLSTERDSKLPSSEENISSNKTKNIKNDTTKETETNKSSGVLFVDLDESSSDSEDKKVKVPSETSVISASTKKNVDIFSNDSTKSSIPSEQPAVLTKKSLEILNLDSDDEETSNTNKAIEQNDGIISTDKMDYQIEKCISPKKISICVNLKCESGPNVPLLPCPIFILGMYQVKRIKKSEHPEICQTCFDSTINETESLMFKFQTGKPLMDVNFQMNDESVEVLDSESDEEEKNDEFIPLPGYDSLAAEELEFVTENLPDMMEHVSRKYKFDEQIEMCNKVILTKAEELEKDTINLNKEFLEVETSFNDIRKTLYETIKIKRQFLPDLLIPYDYEESQESPDTEILAELLDESLLPPVGTNKYETLSIGESVYTIRHSIFGAWIPGVVVEIVPVGTPMTNGMPLMFSVISVKYSICGKATIKQVIGRQVAYCKPSYYLYSIGTRVIALFKDNTASASFKRDCYYSGVIAETPSRVNKYRYLIFFDDGYSQYVYHRDILPVCESSEKVWEDVHPDSRDFIRKYLMSYPERPMVRVNIGHVLKTEHNGVWWDAEVKHIDASLILVLFEKSNKYEWIYRGSTRLFLLYQQLQAADRRAHASGRQRSLRSTNHSMGKMNVPYVEYTRIEDRNLKQFLNDTTDPNSKPETDKNLKPLRAVAKKSTSTAAVPQVEDYTPEVMDNGNQIKSKVVYYSPKIWIHPKKMVPHECGPQCLNRKTPSLSGLRTYHPLAKPLLSAFERLLVKYRYKRGVMYRAPCGRRLRNIEEVHRYLRMTKSDMSVDLFDFDFRVHCLAEFSPSSVLVKRADISHGIEAMAVPCVNYYDHSLPDSWNYSTKRLPTKGVDLNLDENFLCCCDCTDDCLDKTKCQCWQLTLEGTKFIGLKDDNVGYVYKRLYEQILTGIYECNSRCKCAATCLNRVVQHPLQLKLQVFKTYDKGWGIRALNDIPRGSFICVYAGNLLTDAVANDDGKKNEGDKYLADLDYIEIVEKLKENYEADIPEKDKILDKANVKEGENEDEDNEEDEEDDEDDVDDDADDNLNHKSSNRHDSDEEFNPIVPLENVIQKEFKTRLRTRQSQSKNTSNEKRSIVAQGEASKSSTVLSDSQSNVDYSNDKQDPENSGKPKDKTNEDFITISDDEDILREPSRFAAPEGCDNDEHVSKYKSVRSFYGSDDDCFIMDARVTGNIGRYLNHSCSPNVFVQNVFVDTHDPRLPWVAFFALGHIRAGTELTWDYHYDIGSVPGKVIYCKCGSSNCRGRLL